MIDSALKVPIPRFRPDDIKGLQDFWKVYESHREEMRAELLRMAGEHPEQSAAQEQPSHILMEMGLPDTTGFEVVRQMRQGLLIARIIATGWY